MQPERRVRADAQRNRAKVLDVAIELFAARGLSVSVHEIARRAGVGSGTVSRHFPTKEALYEAIVLKRVEVLVRHAQKLAAESDQGAAFFEFLTFLVDEGATDKGLAEALAGAGFDVEQAAEGSGYNFGATLRDLLTRAQDAGAVRSDVDTGDVKALVQGCISRERFGQDAAARRRMVAIATRGLRP